MNGATDPVPTEQVWRITGNPTDDEVAAVTAALTALAGRSSADQANPVAAGWVGHWRRASLTPRPGPDAWRRGVR
ncbi:acyl-CoA carboxylase epsilon subunit [Propionibacteriaceae bacterium Y1685]|uniref:acyl-CoA carboxylase epsilon subunit n=1 Tax=Microlunatus sp. Y1700 TaxID=3418487 RepID=UPI003B79C1A5